MTIDDYPDDSGARRTIVEKLNETLFVEAGAGSGKTSRLVARFVALVESGVGADRIAAITFTEKAAAELADRIREELERRARDGNLHCSGALRVLDRAAIGTVHAFAQRILTEHPIEAGLPPRVRVIDEIGADVAFEARWDDFVDELLADPAMERPIRNLLASGGRVDQLRSIAIEFDRNWDAVADRINRTPPQIPALDTSAILDSLSEVVGWSDHCTDESDKLLEHITIDVTALIQQLRDATDDDAKLEVLSGAKFKARVGRKANWPTIDVEDIKTRLQEIKSDCDALCGQVRDATLQVLAYSLAHFTIQGAEQRRTAGELTFHDLLVLARAVLRDSSHGPAVRAALARRYQRLLLDEFQDTDPIQVELAVLIASDDPDAGNKDWRTVSTEPGMLFFVGDPKQSIYRFRRADIATFLDTRNQVVGSAEALTRNFRSTRPILEWVNATFTQLIEESPGAQPAYTPLAPNREQGDVGPSVAFIGTEHDKRVSADELREAEARDVANAIRQSIQQQWSVSQRADDDTEIWRPARWSDIAVLVPARTSLDVLERHLESAEIPYRLEASSLVYGTREIRDLLLIAQAVDDPTNSLAIVAALRTPSLGCGDDDLAIWKLQYRGKWDYLAPVPGAAPTDHPVASGLSWLKAMHHERTWKSPSEVLEIILRDGRFFELGATQRRPRDLWRRLRFVLDQCRAWEEAGGVTFRQYLRWVKDQSAEDQRAQETILPESDDDAIRILTIHGAKGLEFPIVVLSGMTTKLDSKQPRVEVRFPDTDHWAIKLVQGLSTRDYDDTVEEEDQREYAERLRLMYVATTRARDHLVVSVHRKEGDKPAETSAEVLYEAGCDHHAVEFLQFVEDDLVRASADEGGTEEASPLPSLQQWRDSHEAAIHAAARPIAVSATSLADDDARRFRGDEARLVPKRTGRYGPAIGQAVHEVLQAVDLQTGTGLSELCTAQAVAQEVPGRANVVEALCRSALESEVVKTAASAQHWREVYVGVPDGDGVVEGFIDLLYEDEGGLQIVDYKTDAWNHPSELDAKVERYRVQLEVYARVIGEATGLPVVGASLLFLSKDEAVERAIGHLGATNA